MSIKEQVARSLETLAEAELEEVAEYVSFLRFRARTHAASKREVEHSATLYAEFAAEDRELAEAGMADYAAGLAAEDAK